MKGIIAWMVRNPVAANLLLFMILIAGTSTIFSLSQRTLPEASLDRIRISVEYLGATPSEVEESIVQRIEEQIEAIEGIQEITASAAEGLGTVTIELQQGTDLSRKLDEVKAEIDRITSFPDEAEQPEVREITNRSRVIQIALYGDVSERSLKELARRVKDELTEKDNISYVLASGTREYEISINVSNDTLRSYGLSLDDIAAIVRRNSLDMPAGDIDTGDEKILLRTRGRNYDRRDFENIVLRSNSNGARVRLGDIADIRDGFRDTDLAVEYNGQPASFVDIYTVGNEQVLQISDTVHRYLEEQLRPSLPPGLHAAIWQDSSTDLQDRANLLVKNGSIGLLLVITALALFLDIRLAFWVSLGMFVSFIGTFAVMAMLDISINFISLFAFLLAIGIVVDDAIVTGENIFAERERGTEPQLAAIKGTWRIAAPVIFAVSTTIAAFLPLLFISSTMGKLLSDIPAVVITILGLSLLESLLILPHHLSFLRHLHQMGHNPLMHGIASVQKRFDALLQRFVNGPLNTALHMVTRYYVITILCGLSLILISTGLIAGGFIKFSFFPQVQGNYVTASIELPEGSTIDATRTVAEYVHRRGLQVVDKIERELPEDEPPLLDAVYTSLGQSGGVMTGPSGIGGSAASPNLASVIFKLSRPEVRDYPTVAFERRWREETGAVAGVRKLTFSSELFNAGEPIQVEISARTATSRDHAVRLLREELAGIDGVYDIRDDKDEGKRELELELKPRARSFGLELNDLAVQMRAAFFGAEALRVQRGEDEVRVYVRLPETERNSIADLQDYRIRTPGGAFIPLHEVADIEVGRSPSTIKRVNGRRVITVSANVDSSKTTGQEVNRYLVDRFLPQLEQDIPGFEYQLAGEQREQGRTMGELIRNFLFALFGIYALLAVAFGSYQQPLVIMSAIPFGFIGALLGHVIMGLNFSLLSMFGMVGLAGVIINNSLVMINFINEEYARGAPVRTAIIDGSKGRFRPIMLTSVTTFLGVSPMIFERSFQAQILIPMATSLGFGVLFGTVILMLIVPALSMVPWFSPARNQALARGRPD